MKKLDGQKAVVEEIKKTPKKNGMHCFCMTDRAAERSQSAVWIFGERDAEYHAETV